MRIIITEKQLKLIEVDMTAQEQLEDFNNKEDKIKSSFISKKTVKKWLTYLENKYPSLSFKFEYGNDVLIARAQVKRVNESEDDLESLIGKRVMVYYNLHKHTFSVTYKNKVVVHADYVKLRNVEFRVRVGGKDRVRKEKSKNVHAFVIGDLVEFSEYPTQEIPNEPETRVVTYNPYKYDSFVYKDTEEPIYTATEVDMVNQKNKLFVIKEIVNR